MDQLVGREVEVADAVTVLTDEAGGCVALTGPAGIGKTSVLQAVSDQVAARGAVVRRASGAVAEADLPFVALHDLVGADVAAGAVRLAPNLEEALSVALAPRQTADAPLDARTLGLAVLETLNQLRPQGRLLLVLDDLQWIDPASRAALAFALRRVPRSAVSVLAAARPDTVEVSDVVAGHVHTVTVGPMDAGTLKSVVELRTRRKVPRRLAATLAELSGGNPLLALELVRASGLDLDTVRELPVPERYRPILTPRLAALSAAARSALLAAALLSRPSTTEVARVAPVGAIVEAESAEVITLEHGRVQFTHPLFAALCRERASAADRREMHRLLAEAAEDETERARHLGAAALMPDSDTAARIEKIAAAARDRAAIATAAELTLMAALLTPELEVDERTSRFCDAGFLFHQAGDRASAEQALQTILATAEPGPRRARCLLTLAIVAEGAVGDAIRLLHEAVAQPDLDPATELETKYELSDALINLGDDFTRARALAEQVEAAADAAGLTELAAASRWSQAWFDLAAGTPSEHSEVWRRMVADGPTAPLGYRHPDLLQAWESLFRDDYDRAATLIGDLITRARTAGDVFLEGSLEMHLAEVDVRLGRLDSARTLAEHCYLLQSDGRHDQAPLYIVGCVAAWQGRLEDARRSAGEGLTMAEANGDQLFAAQCLSVLGLVELSDGRYAEAAEHLDRLARVQDEMGWRNPGLSGWHADLVEALLAVDREPDAAALTARLRADADRLGLPSTQALAARCRGLVLSHRGDLAGAEAALLESLRRFEKIDVPLQRARTLMALGVLRRRLKQKARARENLHAAHELFVAHGAAAWAARAEHELERTAAVAAGEQLTSSERDVAALAASGATNREIADRLFISEKTVEAVLTRVYRKLAVRSRTQLAHHPDLADTEPAG